MAAGRVPVDADPGLTSRIGLHANDIAQAVSAVPIPSTEHQEKELQMRIAWIGLGAMGKPMALATLRAGHTLAGYARRPEEHDEIRAAGGVVTDDLAQALDQAQIVCINLYSEAQLREVLIERGALALIPAGSVLVIHSTVSPDVVRELAVLRSDIGVIDAGFSGGADEAAIAALVLMVGGCAADVERARPVLAAYGGHIAHLGPLGAGMTLKIINNLTFAAHMAIAQDVLRLCATNGLAIEKAIDTLTRGSAGSRAFALLGQSNDPGAMLGGIRHYLDKDVAIARVASGHLDLGVLDAATQGFGADQE